MVVVSLECVDHVDSSSLYLPSLVPPSPIIVLLLSCWCDLGLVLCLWIYRRMMYTILEQELLLFVLDREIDLGTIRVDDGFSGGQERSVQDNGCSRVSSSFHNHEFYENI